MNTMLRRSPARFLRFFDGVTDDHVQRPNVEAKYANGMLAVRIPAPRAAMPRTIEVKAA